MSANEFLFWVEHFSYFPFTFDRDDQRLASLISNITWMFSEVARGRVLREPINQNKLIPNYLGERKVVNTKKTLEEQEKEFKAFHMKLKSISSS